jgi:NADH-quinone oxidoreductase subunit L
MSDIKSIIAFSTVNQLSFMFISLLIGFPLLFIFHCLVHALFKSLLFLVAGSLIHVQFNSQSIFKLCYFNLSFEFAQPKLHSNFINNSSHTMSERPSEA